MGKIQSNTEIKGKCFAKLVKLKFKYDDLALREPRTGHQVLDRMVWERLRKILYQRYDYYS